MKSFAILTVSLFAFALAVSPALACYYMPPMQVSAGNDMTLVENSVIAVSDTGGNGIANSQNAMGGFGGDISSGNDHNYINTGDANAYAGAANMVNSNVTVDGCCGPVIQVSACNDVTEVFNNVQAGAFTGGNGIANSTNEKGGFRGDISSNNDGNRIITGDANAYAGAANMVNSNLALSPGCCGPEYQVSVGNDMTFVGNVVIAQASTGGNSIAGSQNAMGCFHGGNISSNNDDNTIITGDANAYAGSVTVVNSNIERSFSMPW
jgi:hypothetical protein